MQRVPLLLSVVAIVSLTVLSATGQSGPGRRPGAASRPAEGPAVQIGQNAPDFDLARLELGPPDANGLRLAKVSGQKVRLSGYHGKKPVVLVFASFT